MSNSNNEFSQTRMKKVLKSQSNKQVSAEAADELGKELEDYAEAVAWKAKELAEDQEDSFKIYYFDTLVQWQPGVTIVKELKEFLWKLRQSKDQLIDQLPDSMIDKLKETIEEIGYDRNAPLMFIFKDKFYIKKTSWDYFLEHVTDPKVNKAVMALALLEVINIENDSNTDIYQFGMPLINNTELFEYVFFRDEFWD